MPPTECQESFFFFSSRRRHTRCSRDWSSDVCSSDLLLDIIRLVDVQVGQEELQIIPIRFADAADLANILNQLFASGRVGTVAPGVPPTEIGRASCRERV